MNPSARLALSLLAALVLWWPTMLASLRGDLDLTAGVARLAVAVLLAWFRIGLVGRLVHGYGAEPDPAPDDEDDPRRSERGSGYARR